MIRIAINQSSDVSPYEQVRTQVAQMVSAGDLEPGERLPTVRQLAADTGLAVNTVARAFRELEADGVITTKGRQGSFVSSAVVDRAHGTSEVVSAAADFASTARARGLSLAEATRLLDEAWRRPG